jgi:hypothetical protein
MALEESTPDTRRFAVPGANAQPKYFGIRVRGVRFARGFALRFTDITGSLRAAAPSGIVSAGAAFYVKVILAKAASRHVDSFRC